MRSYRGVLAIAALVLGAGATACKGSDNPPPADNAGAAPQNNAPGAAAPAQTSGDTDTVDETAPAGQAPPAPQAETPGPAPSPTQLWVGGSWRWDHGKYVWGRGHWEAKRDGSSYHPARWVENNGKWEHHPGHWNSDKPGVGHPAHTDAPRPAAEPARPGEPARPTEPARPGEHRP
jgi:hypothetical protein